MKFNNLALNVALLAAASSSSSTSLFVSGFHTSATNRRHKSVVAGLGNGQQPHVFTQLHATTLVDDDVLVDDGDEIQTTTDDVDASSTTTPPLVVVEFPPPLSGVQRIQRALEFYKRALPVLGAYKVKEIEFMLRDKIPLLTSVSEEEQQVIWNEIDEWGSQRIAETIQEMKGFYVKSGQVISTRVDLFPEAYTSKLQSLQDGLDPMPFELVEQIVSQELLDGAPLSELFSSFEEEPLGSASIEQVHKATLLDGRVVAVKLQRPNVEPKLRGDIANLKRISKLLREQLPVDYYTVFCELGNALENELDFLKEAQAMKKIYLSIQNNNGNEGGGNGAPPPVTIPLPVGELVSKRVLVMDFIQGTPLNKLSEKMKERGIEAGSPEAKIAGRRILKALSEAFGRMIFKSGFIHGDPHPGNIFIGEGAKQVSLIDCGQFKSLGRQRRVQFAQLVLAVADYQDAMNDKNGILNLEDAKLKLADCARSFGIQCVDGREHETDLACAIALVLFSDTGTELPGGYSSNELDENSPIKLLTSFPQELVLLGRATVLLKGIAKKLNVPLSLVDTWRNDCEETLSNGHVPTLPLWSGSGELNFDSASGTATSTDGTVVTDSKIRFKQVVRLLKDWAKGKGTRFAERTIQKLPPKMKTRVLEYIVERQEKQR